MRKEEEGEKSPGRMPLAQLADPWQKMPMGGTPGEVSPRTNTPGAGTAPAPAPVPALSRLSAELVGGLNQRTRLQVSGETPGSYHRNTPEPPLKQDYRRLLHRYYIVITGDM